MLLYTKFEMRFDVYVEFDNKNILDINLTENATQLAATDVNIRAKFATVIDWQPLFFFNSIRFNLLVTRCGDRRKTIKQS